MKRTVGLWELMGFAVTSFGGTILHFLYDWTGGAVWFAPFSGVNESTWEHMKLLFWPMFIISIIQSRYFKEYSSFWCVKLRGILLGLILIPIIFYTYNGAIGRSPDWINIGIFFISAAIAYLYETRMFKMSRLVCKKPIRAFLLLFAIGILFVLFTFFTPEIGIFKAPLSGGFGV